MSSFIVRPIETDTDEAAMRELATQAFNFSDEKWEAWLPLVGKQNLRIAVDNGQVVGGMAFYPIGQWFGGKCVPMAGIALVLTGPEHRGRGYAIRMLTENQRELRAQGFAISTLFASTQQLYRKLGYQQAGNCYDYAVDINSIGSFQSTVPMRRVVAAENLELLQSLATQRAQRENGCIDRNAGMWKRIWHHPTTKVFTYLIGEPGAETGYLIYSQSRSAGRTSPAEQAWEQHAINVRDMVALDSATMQSIWTFLSGNRTVTDLVQWIGPAVDSRMLLTAEYEPKVIRPQRWMLRLLDVRSALLQRGYPQVDATISLDVEDDLIPDNGGELTLQLTDGVPQIHETTTANKISISAANLSALYSGMWTAEQLQQRGMLRCDDHRVLATASHLFRGSEPWMPDSF